MGGEKYGETIVGSQVRTERCRGWVENDRHELGVEVLTHTRRQFFRHPVSVRMAKTFRFPDQFVTVGAFVKQPTTEIRTVSLMPTVRDRTGSSASPR